MPPNLPPVPTRPTESPLHGVHPGLACPRDMVLKLQQTEDRENAPRISHRSATADLLGSVFGRYIGARIRRRHHGVGRHDDNQTAAR